MSYAWAVMVRWFRDVLPLSSQVFAQESEECFSAIRRRKPHLLPPTASTIGGLPLSTPTRRLIRLLWFLRRELLYDIKADG